MDTQPSVRLYLDADLTPTLAEVLRLRGYDVVSAYDMGSESAPDPEQMAFAAAQRRAILTCNIKDFTPLFQEYWFAGREHSGVVVSEQLEFRELLRRVTLFLDTVTAEDMLNNWKNLAEFATK